jgi:ribosomal protein S6--L-glutamate ligase
VDLFATLGKETFASVNCYRLRGDRLKQTALLHLLGAPQPRTRIYYGHKQKQEILKDFVFPFVAKKALFSSDNRHVFLISESKKLDWYNRRYNPAYIQEYVTAGQEVRVVVLNNHKVCGYWRRAARGSSKSYRPQGGKWQMEEVPAGVAALATDIARDAGLSDVAVDMIFDGSRYWVLELNFRYGVMDWPQSGKDRIKMVLEMIKQGEL